MVVGLIEEIKSDDAKGREKEGKKNGNQRGERERGGKGRRDENLIKQLV